MNADSLAVLIFIRTHRQNTYASDLRKVLSMAEKTLHEENISREEVADRLQTFAHEFREGGDANIDVSNKTVTLSPSSSVGYEIGTRESSSVLRVSRESVTIKLDWKPK
jgi:amphi-Trp domain-containing protein